MNNLSEACSCCWGWGQAGCCRSEGELHFSPFLGEHSSPSSLCPPRHSQTCRCTALKPEAMILGSAEVTPFCSRKRGEFAGSQGP